MISTALLIAALVCFCIGVLPPATRLNWVSLGLALWAVSALATRHLG